MYTSSAPLAATRKAATVETAPPSTTQASPGSRIMRSMYLRLQRLYVSGKTVSMTWPRRPMATASSSFQVKL